MSASDSLRVRRSLTDLQADYEAGNKKPLEDLMRAWKGIKALPPDDPRSFHVLGGYHGEPFRGAGWGNASYWGGYCAHGNILFPTWHRVYLLKLEEALRSIPGCADVTLPFWDECSDASLKGGIPWALTAETFDLDGETIPNPLRSYVFPLNIVDHISPDPVADYSKPKGYETVRYPLSGLVGSEADRIATQEHNALFPDYATNVDILNKNIVAWLTSTIVIGGQTVSTSIRDKYLKCLDAPNYTVFSNTTSRDEWNDNAAVAVQALESPHNSMHLAVGGFDVPIQDASVIPGANGDMGENDTAALDPIFYFHHCFVDLVFWAWQKRHHQTETLDIIAGYPGTNSVDNQGPTPGVAANSWLTIDSPLDPFTMAEAGTHRTYTSRDCCNIETQLGYTYRMSSIDALADEDIGEAAAPAGAEPEKRIRVSGINRGRIRGSFLISAFVNEAGERKHLGTEAVLSRWHVEGCANCQTHLQARASFGLHGIDAESLDEGAIEVEVQTRDGLLGGAPRGPGIEEAVGAERPLFKVVIR